MKYVAALIILSCGFLGHTELYSQTRNPLIAKWKNSYGSILDINEHNIDGVFTGTYSSSTGATGKYNILGFSPPVSDTSSNHQPLSLTIYWSPVEQPKGTCDEEWTSTMTGQIMLDKSGSLVMELFHSLNASCPLPAVNVQHEGRYSETLTFTPSSDISNEFLPSHKKKKVNQFAKKSAPSSGGGAVPPFLQNPLVGRWINNLTSEYPALSIDAVNNPTSMIPGSLIGRITGANTKQVTSLIGFTAASVPIDGIQSVSFSFMNTDAQGITYCFSASGFLYFDSDRLELTIYKSRAVPYSSKYTSVQVVSKAVFHRTTPDAIDLTMQRNPFTNNGASEWTASIGVGSAVVPPLLKFGIDTGGNFLWVNSTQCQTSSCTGYGHVQFDPAKSSSFKWIDQESKKINWGPWGSAQANLGADYLHFLGKYTAPLTCNMKLITHFDETPQFDEFLWDGAIAFPANSSETADSVSNVMKLLVDQGTVSPDKACMAFYFNPDSGFGLATVGNWDSTLVDLTSKLVFDYSAYEEVPYLWCSTLQSFSMGDQKIASKGYYSFDTGSSALKGDSARMTQALNYAEQVFEQTGTWPPMHFEMGVDRQGNVGKITLTSDQYVQLIEQGEKKGERVPQIQTLSGTPDLYLQGSTLFNYVYVVFWWDAKPKEDGTYDLTAREVWCFNKKEGPKIIQDGNTSIVHNISRKNILNGLVYPNPAWGVLNVQFELEAQSDVTVIVNSSGGVTLHTEQHNDLSVGSHTIKIEHTDRFLLKPRETVLVKVISDGKTILTRRALLH